jgi:hypothetical protein
MLSIKLVRDVGYCCARLVQGVRGLFAAELRRYSRKRFRSSASVRDSLSGQSRLGEYV